jgi:hypothetical protein
MARLPTSGAWPVTIMKILIWATARLVPRRSRLRASVRVHSKAFKNEAVAGAFAVGPSVPVPIAYASRLRIKLPSLADLHPLHGNHGPDIPASPARRCTPRDRDLRGVHAYLAANTPPARRAGPGQRALVLRERARRRAERALPTPTCGVRARRLAVRRRPRTPAFPSAAAHAG